MPRQMPSTGTPASARSRSSSTSPSAREAAHRLGERAHARQHDRVGAGDRRRGRRCAPRARRRARAPSRRCAGCPSRSRRARRSRQRPLRRRHAGLVGIDRDRHAQRAGERLEARLDHVVRVRARPAARGAASAAPALATARKNSSAASCSKPAIAPGGQLEARHAAVRAAGEVDRARRARLVHRHDGVPVAADPARGRRAPRRAPARARSRCPRPCGARPSRGRPGRVTSSPSRPWRASRSSMWSKKPTPVSISPRRAAVEVEADG